MSVLTPERKAQIAMATMGAMIERIKLETAMLKGDAVGIATHAKGLAQHQAKAFAASSPAPDPQRTITVPVPSGNHSEIHNVIQGMRDRGFRI